MGDDSKPVIAFLGPEGSYTHQATLARFPESSHTLAPQRTIADIFAAVTAGRSAQGVVPFENSTNGSVVSTLDLLAAAASVTSSSSKLATATTTTTTTTTIAVSRSSSSPTLQVRAEIYQAVQHSLCVAPGLPAGTPITKLYSHPQAWGQCARFLGGAEWRGVERLDVSSTSRAAEMVAAEGAESTSGAISSAVAARMFGLRVLQEGVEDVAGNSTRFFVLEPRAGEGVVVDGGNDANDDADDDDDSFKTLVTFTVSHAEPGALADCLAVFKRFGLNLTSINTRPSGESPWHYVFFVEFVGRKWKGNDKGKVNEALRELDQVALEWQWMGSWRNELLKR